MPDAYIFPHTGPPNGPIVGRKDGRKIEAYLLSLRSVVAAEGLDELATGSSTGPRWSVALRPHRGAGRAGGDLPSFNGATVVRGVATAVCPSCTSLASTLQRGHGAPWRCDAWLCRSPPGWPPPFNGATVVRGVATTAAAHSAGAAVDLQRGHGGPWRCDVYMSCASAAPIDLQRGHGGPWRCDRR